MQCLKKLFHVAQSNIQYYNKINLIHRRKEFAVQSFIHRYKHDFSIENEEYEGDEEEKDNYMRLANEYLGIATEGKGIFIIQPYVKWGSNKKRLTTPELQLAEAVALINTLPNWNVVGTKLVPLLTLQKTKLIGSGALATLQKEIRCCPNVTAIFVSTHLLKFGQIAVLQEAFNLPIYDRYSVVIHIFRKHAKSAVAKLQVALAEIPYIKQKMIDLSGCDGRRINMDERDKELLGSREKKLKNALKRLKDHRKMLKRQRDSRGFLTIAVVGYTNAGKTSLIKSLTGTAKLEPENKLFATLDTTIHPGYLNNKLKVLYIDTIGFIQDVPEMLIEPFKVTLEDAINADLIVHVYDASHPDVTAQFQHIQKTLEPMIGEEKAVISVANKCDIVKTETIPEDGFPVSCLKLTGLDELKSKIEEAILASGNIMKKRIRVGVGSTSESWLYKETTVTDVVPDSENSQFVIMDVVMTTSTFYKFKRFLNNLNAN